MISWILSFFKSKKQNLVDKYNRLLSESHRLSTINRTQSDIKAAQANQVLIELDELLQEEDQGKYPTDPIEIQKIIDEQEKERIQGSK